MHNYQRAFANYMYTKTVTNSTPAEIENELTLVSHASLLVLAPFMISLLIMKLKRFV